MKYNDPVIVVRCEDCKYFKPFESKGYGECASNYTFSGAFRNDDYCSYGKRSDDICGSENKLTRK